MTGRHLKPDVETSEGRRKPTLPVEAAVVVLSLSDDDHLKLLAASGHGFS